MTALDAAAAVVGTTRLGRFELRRILGRGAQATVWLAFDPRLEREVAVKLLRDGDAAAVGDWLHEARNVSRLTHPHIVPVFEADVHDGQPYLVFEYVAGPTLSERIREGAMPARAAVQTLLGVLDALTAAHAAGLVHRDLKPSNILIDPAGRARVMDFGIAARVRDGASDGRIVGTPGYMSPEAAGGAAAAPAMDVFAAGVVLVEMLSGARLLHERDPHRAIVRVRTEDLALPPLGADVDDALRALLYRAIARDAAQRLPSAAAFHAALSQWLHPLPPEPATGPAAGTASSGTLDFLLRRMRHKSDFPALSDSVVRIQRVADSDHENLSSLANEILKDVALTNKLLRMVNTAQFRHAGGGSISTVSRAVALVGFAGIRNMALSLVLLEHMQDKAHASQIRDEFLRALMAGAVASELCASARDGEEVFIGAMFQGLGRLLTEYYFPEEANRVRALRCALDGRPAPSEAQASISVLGLSFEALGLGVARSWGLPETLQRCMSRPGGETPAGVAGRERLRWLSAAGNDVADALLHHDAAQAGKRIDEIAQRYARPLGIGGKELHAAAERSRERLVQTAQAMNLHVPVGAPARRLLDAPPDTLPVTRHEDSLTPHQLQATLVLHEQATLPGKASDVLAAGIQDITNSMVAESFRLNDVLRMILEVMYRAMGFRRVVFCLRDPKSQMLTGRFGLGDDVEAACAAFKVPLRVAPGRPGADLFSAVCLKGADTLIADATAPGIVARLPAWFGASINAPAFLLLPLMVKNAPFGLIYADKTLPGAIELGEKELSMLRTLRNQAVMAFRQTGG
jgi:eukaryotic-like serine/threonine-protein kinase